jgi:UDP-N-acetylglucosamine 2-epimerase (non-hydrolysing)
MLDPSGASGFARRSSPVTRPVLIHLVCAARPNFMKVAPLYHAFARESWCESLIIHTGQHYDANMSAEFFTDLKLPSPDHHLGVGSGTHAEQTGGVMIAYEKVVEQRRPDFIVVVGDVNSTLACAMVGAKLRVPVVHLEAGLRSDDRSMPEEINRIATDAIADVLWTPSTDANATLRREGVPDERVDFVGNIMLDSFELLRSAVESDPTRAQLGLTGEPYAVATLHRPANVDTRAALEPLVEQLLLVARRLRVVFAVHPRTRQRLTDFGLLDRLISHARLTLTAPLSYVPFMRLVTGAAAVVTDSGGVQQETTYLGISCLTLRHTTEWGVTLEHGTNSLVRPDELAATLDRVLAHPPTVHGRPELWDGHSASRCVAALRRRATLPVGHCAH